MNQRGISPVVATVLLVAMVIVIGLIIFLWFRGFIDEAITKEGTNIELVCDEVIFAADYTGGYLSISNTGNIHIQGMKVKLSKNRGYDTVDLEDFEEGLSQGEAYLDEFDAGEASSITLIPILLGTAESGETTYVCDEKRHGYEILV